MPRKFILLLLFVSVNVFSDEADRGKLKDINFEEIREEREYSKKMEKIHSVYADKPAIQKEDIPTVTSFLIDFCKIENNQRIESTVRTWKKSSTSEVTPESIQNWCNCRSKTYIAYGVFPPITKLYPSNYSALRKELREYSLWYGSRHEKGSEFRKGLNDCVYDLIVPKKPVKNKRDDQKTVPQ